MPQSDALFVVTDRYELLALWRLVAEAKFQSDPDDRDLWGSPYVHALATRIAKAMLDDHQNMGDQDAIERHVRWKQSLPNNVVLPTIKANLLRDASEKWWLAMSKEEKVAYVRGCVAPFEPNDDFISTLLQDAETG